jgi:hypothetical protein
VAKFRDWTPGGVIPAVLLPFRADFSLDQRVYRAHLLHPAITVSGLDRDTPEPAAAPLAAE